MIKIFLTTVVITIIMGIGFYSFKSDIFENNMEIKESTTDNGSSVDVNIEEFIETKTSPSPTLLPTVTPIKEKISVKETEIVIETPTPTSVVEKTTCPTLSNDYATIIDLRDSLDNVFKQSAYNNCSSSGGHYNVKNGDKITITVNTNNDNSNPVHYEFVGNGFPNKWQTENSASITVDDKYETIHLRVFIKNSDEKYRAPDYDDMIQIFYKVEQ